MPLSDKQSWYAGNTSPVNVHISFWVHLSPRVNRRRRGTFPCVSVTIGCTESVLLCYFCFICVYFGDFYSDGIPVPVVTYTQQELFACNNPAVSGGKLPQPLFEAIEDNGMCAVMRGCRAGRNCNRQRTIRPVIGRRPGFRPTFHQRGVNNNNIIHVKLSTCQIVGNDCYTNMALINVRSVKNKTLTTNEEITQHDWDILAITET